MKNYIQNNIFYSIVFGIIAVACFTFIVHSFFSLERHEKVDIGNKTTKEEVWDCTEKYIATEYKDKVYNTPHGGTTLKFMPEQYSEEKVSFVNTDINSDTYHVMMFGISVESENITRQYTSLYVCTIILRDGCYSNCSSYHHR